MVERLNVIQKLNKGIYALQKQFIWHSVQIRMQISDQVNPTLAEELEYVGVKRYLYEEQDKDIIKIFSYY